MTSRRGGFGLPVVRVRERQALSLHIAGSTDRVCDDVSVAGLIRTCNDACDVIMVSARHGTYRVDYSTTVSPLIVAKLTV